MIGTDVDRRVVLVVGAEVPSSCHDLRCTDREDILAQILFADGAGAAIVAPEGAWRFSHTGSHIVPDSSHLLGLVPDHPEYPLVNTMKMTLNPEVPAALERYFTESDDGRAIVNMMMQGTTFRPAMAVHPGGPRILGAVQKVLSAAGWPNDALDSCLKTFNTHGNLGSTAALVVLHDLLHDACALGDHDRIGMLAFGPGVTVEHGVLHRS